MRALISWSTAERTRIPQNGHYAIAPEASLSMMVCGRFYSLRVESPSGYDILRTSGSCPAPLMRPHVSHTTSAAAACRSAHAGRVLDDCRALPDSGLHGTGLAARFGRGCEARHARCVGVHPLA